MRSRPRLINVQMISTNVPDLFGIECMYSDGIGYREAWGSREETQLAVEIRERDIYSPANLRP